MKYIEAEKITAEIDKIIDGLKRNCNPDPLGTTEECLAAAEIEALELLKTTIDQMHQEQPTPPGIEEESQKKGWLVLHVTKMSSRLMRAAASLVCLTISEDEGCGAANVSTDVCTPASSIHLR